MNRDVWVDFNDISDDGEVCTLPKFAERSLEVGEKVLAGDDEGNRCQATVVRVDRKLIVLSLDMATFAACANRKFAHSRNPC